jgi:hypothetical protein
MKLPRLSPDCELEHADIKLAKARPVANDLKPRDRGVREGEGQYERRLYESQPMLK